MSEDLEMIEKKIGLTFDNKDFLKLAFTHRSYLNENKRIKEHNERLEFLGDAVLELAVTEHLYKNYKNPEGELTNWRSALVKTETISETAKELGYEEHLKLSKGESKSTGRARQLILANTFEAVVGAIYLDQGFEVARKFIEEKLIVKLPKILETKAYIDAKSSFQELAQEKEGITPVYKVLSEEGPDHEKIFTMGVYLEEKQIGKGTGPSKQSAEQAA
ncbi:ribonuclease III, partial [bacterium (Candidatus Howlettbacteria) CG_4_10_14_0_8_um_filter_40_9]